MPTTDFVGDGAARGVSGLALGLKSPFLSLSSYDLKYASFRLLVFAICFSVLCLATEIFAIQSFHQSAE